MQVALLGPLFVLGDPDIVQVITQQMGMAVNRATFIYSMDESKVLGRHAHCTCVLGKGVIKVFSKGSIIGKGLINPVGLCK